MSDEPQAAPAPQSPAPHVDAPSEDIAPATSATLPGAHRGGFQRELTEPVPIATPVIAGEGGATRAPAPEPEVRWAPTAEVLPRTAPWALTFAVLGLVVSFLVGWGFLIGLVGAVLAIVALRRPWEARAIAVWALCLSALSLLYSAGWLWWASTQGPLLG